MPHPFPWPYQPAKPHEPGEELTAAHLKASQLKERLDRVLAEAHGMTPEQYTSWQNRLLTQQQLNMQKAMVGQTPMRPGSFPIYDEYKRNKEAQPMDVRAKNLQEEITKVTPGVVTVFDVAREAFGDEDGKGAAKVTVELSHREQPLLRTETGPRNHTLHTAAALADYLARYGCRETVVYCDLVVGEFTAVLNEKAPAGVEWVEMKPAVHPLWRPWAAVLQKKMPVRDLCAFLRLHRANIVEPDGKELLMALAQISASLQVTRHEGSGKNALNGVLVRTRIQGKEDSSLVELPDVLAVEMPLFIGAVPSKVEVELVLEADGEGVVFATLHAPSLENDRIQALEMGVDRLRADKRLADLGIVIVSGAPEWLTWNYVKDRR